MCRRSRFIFLTSICLILAMALIPIMTACTDETTAPAPAPAPAPEPVKPITLIFSTHDPEANMMVNDIMKTWFAMIEDRSGGRIKIEPHYAGELASVPEAYGAVVKGTVDIAHSIITHEPSHLMENAFNLSVFDNISFRPSRTYMELYQQFPEFQAQYDQVKPVILYSMYAAHVGTTKKPVYKLEDVKGLKMVCGGILANTRGEGLGMIPVSASPPEVFSFWEKGVADGGTVVTAPNLFSSRWGDVIKYLTTVTMARSPQSVIMNRAKFNSLPPDLQKIFDDALIEMTDVADASQYKSYTDAIARAPAEFGMEIIDLSKEELARWVAADRPVIDSFIAELDAAGVPGAKFFEAYQALEKKYSAPEYRPN
ncbi:TRAP transporter substrate-binding protein DctP [Chloroflexota bacterium]